MILWPARIVEVPFPSEPEARERHELVGAFGGISCSYDTKLLRTLNQQVDPLLIQRKPLRIYG